MTQRICDCAYQFKDTSLPGCMAFKEKPEGWGGPKNPHEGCWNQTSIDEATKREKNIEFSRPIPSLAIGINELRFSEEGGEIAVAKRNLLKRR